MAEQKSSVDKRCAWERNRDAAIGNLGKLAQNPALPKEVREKVASFISNLALIRRALPKQEARGKPPSSS